MKVDGTIVISELEPIVLATEYRYHSRINIPRFQCIKGLLSASQLEAGYLLRFTSGDFHCAKTPK